LLDELARRGALDNTLVVFSSDHGEMLGDHNGWGKSKPWQPSIGVPMVLAGPGVQPGMVHRGPATNLDLTATFLDCAGVTVPDTMDSRSLMPLLSGRTDHHRDVVVSALNDWQVAFDGRMKYVKGFGKTALYDLAADPGENHNLIDDPACAEAPSKLQTALPQQKSHAAQAP
jgi:choline-sulfatase